MKITPYINNPLKNIEGEKVWCAFRSIIYINGLFYFFSEGFIKERWEIYILKSSDGIILDSKSDSIFPVGGQGTFDEKGQADPTVIYENGQWKMWFDALNGKEQWDMLGYATSENGLKWVNHGPVLGRGTGWDSKAVHHPCVIKTDKYYMFYSGTDSDTGNVKNIGLAISDDGIKWVKKDDPVLTVGDWDYNYIRPSCPVLIKDLWHMFYWGFGDNHYMGLATSGDLVHWTKKVKVLESDVPHEGITASMPIKIDNELRIYYATFDDIHIRFATIDE
jgi:predicted GH43/DUF377 family glycosyl hydrolase